MPVVDDRLDRLYRLLPAIHRIRDHERGQPLRALLQVIAEQVNVFEDDIDRLYENWFIETCEDWVVPYIGDLIGYEPVEEGGRTAAQAARSGLLTPRREVANTIRYRRRKGTLAVLELLGRDVAGWPCRAVEFRQLLLAQASLRTQPAKAGRIVDVRRTELAGTEAFDTLMHTIDVRRINSHRGRGRYDLANVGLFVWRLKAYSVTRAPARCVEDVGPNCFTFSVLGNKAPLFNRPKTETDDHTIAGPLNVPAPIDRRVFSARVKVRTEHTATGVAPDSHRDALRTQASTDYYGLAASSQGESVAQSIAIWAPDWPGADAKNNLITAEHVIPADLSGWTYAPKNGFIAVDPVLGRIVFPIRQRPRGVDVSYHYGFSADLGGGEYERPLLQEEGVELIRVEGREQLQQALERWRPLPSGPGHHSAHPLQPAHAVIEIADSDVYVLPVNIYLAAGHTLQLRAAQRKRPVLHLLDWHTDAPGNLSVAGGPGSRFTLDGIMVMGRGVQVEGDVTSFTVRHSTLVPGWSLDPECEPERPSEPSIAVIDSHACIVVEHSIVGSIQINNNEVTGDPVPIRISDSIVDATGVDCEKPSCEAIGAAGPLIAHAELHIVRSTVIGRVMVHAIVLAENSIFLSRVTVARRQIGCVRFCYLTPGSRTPRRFNCQPDLVERAAVAAMETGATTADVEQSKAQERQRVRPRLVSMRYGTPTYCQLAESCAPEITRGADDESEMGVFHDQFQPQRIANLTARLEEFVPAASDVGIILVN